MCTCVWVCVGVRAHVCAHLYCVPACRLPLLLENCKEYSEICALTLYTHTCTDAYTSSTCNSSLNHLPLTLLPYRPSPSYSSVHSLFDLLRTHQPDFANKIIVLEGDLTAPGTFGLSETDLANLRRNCNVVIHSAASVYWTMSLKEAYVDVPFLPFSPLYPLLHITLVPPSCPFTGLPFPRPLSLVFVFGLSESDLDSF